MYDKLDKDRKIIADEYIERINTLSGSELTNSIQNLIKDLKDGYNIETEEEIREIDLSVSEQQELLDAIYENIKDEEDKRIFGLEIIESSKDLDSKIIEDFQEKMQIFVDKDHEESESTETEEELDEEKDKEDIPDLPADDDITDPVDEEEKEEEKTEEIEGPAITQYKKETDELKQKLAELEAQLNNSDDYEELEDNNELDEIIAQTTAPEIEIDNEAIEELNKLIEKITTEKEFWERKRKNFIDENPNYASFEDKVREFNDYGRVINKLDEEVKKAEIEIEELKNKTSEKDGKTVQIPTAKFRNLYEQEIKKLEETYKQLEAIQNKYYEDKMGIPLEIYGMKSKIEELIPKMQKDINEKFALRSFININDPENIVLIDNIKECRELNATSKEQINEKFKDKLEESPKTTSNNEELLKQIEELKKEIGDRENNIATYYDVLKDINDIDNSIKSGKTPEDEDIKNKVNAVKEKINPLPESLKKELEEYLNKALTMKIENVKKDPKKWHKWVAGAAGLVVGAGIVALTPIGFGTITLTALGLKMGVKALHKHFLKKDAKLAKENEITGIEKPNEKQKSIASKFREFMKDENNIKNINWFLTGSVIGAGIGSYAEWIMSLGENTATVSNTMTGGVESTGSNTMTGGGEATVSDPYSEIRIGDSASKLDLSQGYDSANFAANNVNVESLNHTIMQDGNSIIDSVGIVREGGTQVIDTAGKSIAEIAQQYGVSPEEVILNITNQQGAPRAWVDAAEAVGRVMK